MIFAIFTTHGATSHVPFFCVQFFEGNKRLSESFERDCGFVSPKVESDRDMGMIEQRALQLETLTTH
jgi:hypothetical protein